MMRAMTALEMKPPAALAATIQALSLAEIGDEEEDDATNIVVVGTGLDMLVVWF